MFDLSNFKQISTLSGMFLCFFITALPAIATSDLAEIKKLEEQQETVTLVSSDTEKLQSQQQADVPTEKVEPRTTSISNFYNKIFRVIQNLPSNGQSRDIRIEDNNIQRLLKQQVNDSLEVYLIIGQLLEEGKLVDSLGYDVSSFISNTNLSFYQGVLIAVAETNLVTDTEEKLIANNACLEIAKEGNRIAQLRLEAGLGTRIDVLITRYLRRHCEIQRIELKLGRNDIELDTIRENIRESLQQQPINLAESEREIAEARQNPNVPDLLVNYYINNIKLLQKLDSQGRSLEIQTDDSDLQKLYKQQLNDALDLYSLIRLRIASGIMHDERRIGIIMLPAVLVALADIDLSTEANKRELANRTCLKIAQAWEEYISLSEAPTSKPTIQVLTVDYWKRQCDIQKLQTDNI